MARICTICQKGSMVVGGYSNKVRATKYNPIAKIRKRPNLQYGKTKSGDRVLLCTKCLKRGKNLTIA